VAIFLIGTANGCQTVPEIEPVTIEIPELGLERPQFPIDKFDPAPTTEAELLHNFLLLDVYTMTLESYTDGLESYIKVVKDIVMSD
jgi:hypothetical protein